MGHIADPAAGPVAQGKHSRAAQISTVVRTLNQVPEHDALIFGEFSWREQRLSRNRDATGFFQQFVQVCANGSPGQVPGVKLATASWETRHKLAHSPAKNFCPEFCVLIVTHR